MQIEENIIDKIGEIQEKCIYQGKMLEILKDYTEFNMPEHDKLFAINLFSEVLIAQINEIKMQVDNLELNLANNYLKI